MKNSLRRVADDELHEELCDTELGLEVVDGVPQVELLMADHLADGPDICVYATSLKDIFDVFINDRGWEEISELRAVASCLTEALNRVNAHIAESEAEQGSGTDSVS